MFLKKKEKNPNWTKKEEWAWGLKGAQPRPSIGHFPKDIDPIQIKDPSRHAILMPMIEKQLKEQHERRKLEIRQLKSRRPGGILKGIGDYLFGDW